MVGPFTLEEGLESLRTYRELQWSSIETAPWKLHVECDALYLEAVEECVLGLVARILWPDQFNGSTSFIRCLDEGLFTLEWEPPSGRDKIAGTGVSTLKTAINVVSAKLDLVFVGRIILEFADSPSRNLVKKNHSLLALWVHKVIRVHPEWTRKYTS
jgi:hypothetical protein